MSNINVSQKISLISVGQKSTTPSEVSQSEVQDVEAGVNPVQARNKTLSGVTPPVRNDKLSEVVVVEVHNREQVDRSLDARIAVVQP